MPDPDEARELADRVAARAVPGEQLEVYVASSESTGVRAYDGEIESFTRATAVAVGIRVVADGRQGFASAGSFAPDVVAATLAEARDNARFGEPDGDYGLAEPDGVPPPTLQLWHEGLVAATTQHKLDLALELERVTVGVDRRIHGVRSAAYRDAASARAVATNTGISVAERATSCSLSVVALARDGEDTATGAGVSVAREPGGLDLQGAARDAGDRAVSLLGASQPRSGRFAVVFEPRLAASVVELVGSMLAGEMVLKGRSLFADRLGEAMASPLLSMVEDPTDERSFGAGAHDGEGLASRQVPLIRAGVLDQFLHNTYTARRMGTVSTASAVRGARSTPGTGATALAVAPGVRGHDQLVTEIDRGVLVRSLSGLHSGVNPVSGDLSVGIEGLAIRNGELAEPLREATLASTVPRLLGNLVAVGSDREWLPGGTATPTLVFDDLTLSGDS